MIINDLSIISYSIIYHIPRFIKRVGSKSQSFEIDIRIFDTSIFLSQHWSHDWRILFVSPFVKEREDSFARFYGNLPCNSPRANLLSFSPLPACPSVRNFLALTPRRNTTRTRTKTTRAPLPSSRTLALFLRRWKIRRVSKARHIKRSK